MKNILYLLASAAALLLSGCRSGRDVAGGPMATGSPMAPTNGKTMASPTPPAPQLTDNDVGQLQPPAPSAPAREHREYRKNLKQQAKAAARVAKAQPRTVPLIQGRAAVSAPLATQVQASYKPRGPVVQADTGAVVQVSTAGKNGQAQAGNGNRQQRAEPERPPWWRTLLNWWPVPALGLVVWLFWPAILALLRRRV